MQPMQLDLFGHPVSNARPSGCPSWMTGPAPGPSASPVERTEHARRILWHHLESVRRREIEEENLPEELVIRAQGVKRKLENERGQHPAGGSL